MKTITFKIILVLLVLAGFNYVFSNTVPDTTNTIPQEEFKINRTEELQSFCNKGISYYKMAEYLSGEDAKVDGRTNSAFCR